jgi:hypothetical protein
MVGKTGEMLTLNNNIAIDCNESGFGGLCFDLTDLKTGSSNNESSDVTSESMGPNPMSFVSGEYEFVSVTPGSIDLHILDDASAHQKGKDLGTIEQVNLDIVYGDRDAQVIPWDIGANQFFPPVVSITSVDPSKGTVEGTTLLTILGENFQGICEVMFGPEDDGYYADYVDFLSSSHIECPTPAHPEGVVDITVINADTTQGTKENAYEFVGTPDPIPVNTPGGTSCNWQASGVKLLGAVGATGPGTYPWFLIGSQSCGTLKFKLKGGAEEIECLVQVCLTGGESQPKTLCVVTPSSQDDVEVEIPVGAFDKIRVVVTRCGPGSIGSQIRMSGRGRRTSAQGPE